MGLPVEGLSTLKLILLSRNQKIEDTENKPRPSTTTFFNTGQLKFILLGEKINSTNLEIFIKN